MMPFPRRAEKGSDIWKRREEDFWKEAFLRSLEQSARINERSTEVTERAAGIANLALEEYRKFHEQLWEDELEAGDPEWERE